MSVRTFEKSLRRRGRVALACVKSRSVRCFSYVIPRVMDTCSLWFYCFYTRSHNGHFRVEKIRQWSPGEERTQSFLFWRRLILLCRGFNIQKYTNGQKMCPTLKLRRSSLGHQVRLLLIIIHNYYYSIT